MAGDPGAGRPRVRPGSPAGSSVNASGASAPRSKASACAVDGDVITGLAGEARDDAAVQVAADDAVDLRMARQHRRPGQGRRAAARSRPCARSRCERADGAWRRSSPPRAAPAASRRDRRAARHRSRRGSRRLTDVSRTTRRSRRDRRRSGGRRGACRAGSRGRERGAHGVAVVVVAGQQVDRAGERREQRAQMLVLRRLARIDQVAGDDDRVGALRQRVHGRDRARQRGCGVDTPLGQLAGLPDVGVAQLDDEARHGPGRARRSGEQRVHRSILRRAAALGRSAHARVRLQDRDRRAPADR